MNSSRCANVVAGAGSVRSSTVPYIAYSLVISPLLLDVIRSFLAPLSFLIVGW